MLIEFTVGNFKSFRDRVTFSMVATNTRAKDKRVDEENVVRAGGDLALLRSAVVYGANASGKSNLGAALAFMRRFVLNSSKDTQADEPIAVEPFVLSDRTKDAPSYFELVFLLDGRRFRYGFELTADRVITEWLHHVPGVREVRLFSRDEALIKLAEAFKEGRGLEKLTRRNALFLSVVAQFNGSTAQQILSWFGRFDIITGLEDHECRSYTLDCLDNNRYHEDIARLVKTLDLGIDELNVRAIPIDEFPFPVEMPEALKSLMIEQIDRVHRVTTVHRTYDEQGRQTGVVRFSLDGQESEGTKKLFSFAGPLIHALKTGRVLFIDEFDARLHPLVTRSLVGLFNSRETNPHNSQLIFTTHDTNLLTNRLFRRDQIWFTEKDRQGSTRLYSLIEYKVRNDASFESDYIRGKYGAIPFVGDLGRLIGETSEA
jgi:AAA15 family ATPase/GTPase